MNFTPAEMWVLFMPQGEVDRKDRRSCGYGNGLGQGDKP